MAVSFPECWLFFSDTEGRGKPTFISLWKGKDVLVWHVDGKHLKYPRWFFCLPSSELLVCQTSTGWRDDFYMNHLSFYLPIPRNNKQGFFFLVREWKFCFLSRQSPQAQRQLPLRVVTRRWLGPSSLISRFQQTVLMQGGSALNPSQPWLLVPIKKQLQSQQFKAEAQNTTCSKKQDLFLRSSYSIKG